MTAMLRRAGVRTVGVSCIAAASLLVLLSVPDLLWPVPLVGWPLQSFLESVEYLRHPQRLMAFEMRTLAALQVLGLFIAPLALLLPCVDLCFSGPSKSVARRLLVSTGLAVVAFFALDALSGWIQHNVTYPVIGSRRILLLVLVEPGYLLHYVTVLPSGFCNPWEDGTSGPINPLNPIVFLLGVIQPIMAVFIDPVVATRVSILGSKRESRRRA